MGIFYLQIIDGDEYYACAGCETHIATPDHIVSKVSSLKAGKEGLQLIFASVKLSQQFHG